MGINVKDENGNTVMTIDGTNGITIQKGSIQWSDVSGRPSIPRLPGYIQSTYIDATKVESFHIKGNKVEAVIPKASNGDDDTGFILTGTYGQNDYRYLRIYSFAGDEALTVFTSPARTTASWSFPITRFHGLLDFSNATTYGLHLTLA